MIKIVGITLLVLVLLVTACGQADQAPQEAGIAEIGLAFEVPADWQQVAGQNAWTPSQDSGVRVGVDWMELEPPMEVEAVMLPGQSQVLASEPVTLSWAGGRRITLEVYVSPWEGEGRAPVESVESHVLVVRTDGGTRLAVDFYASAPTEEALKEAESVLQRMVDSSRLDGD